MSDRLKLQYTAALENWTMPILRLSKHKGTFGNTKKRRKTAMIEPLLREITEKNDEKPRSKLYETYQRNLKMSELKGVSLIKIHDIVQKDSKITIVQGTGGIGKTSLVDYITYQWAQNEMFQGKEELQFSFVFRFQCRSLNRYQGRKLTANDLFMEKFNINISDVGDKVGKILIILDGFDEYFAYSDVFKFSNKEDSITRIVRDMVSQGTVLFPGHYNLVTGRHHAVDLLQTREKYTGKARWVEMLGFSEHAVEKYVDQFSEGNSSLAAYIKSRLTSSVTLQSLATTPVFLRTLCSMLSREGDELYEFIGASLVKMTDIYSWIVGSFLKFHFASEDQEFSEIPLSQLLSRRDVRKFLRNISKDAYELLVANALEFDCEKLSSVDMSDPVIRNLVNGFVIRSEDELESKCEFWHVTMHEYFAAYHCVTTKACPTLILREKNWHKAVQFMAGFISTRRRKAKSINHLLIGKSLQIEDDRINDFLYHEPFLKTSCNRRCKKRFLEIFFESFAIGDIFSTHLGPQYWGESALDVGMLLLWNIFSLSDAVLFSHFGKIMIANGMGYKLGDVWLWLTNTKPKKNFLIDLFEVLPYCHYATIVSVRLEDTIDIGTSNRLLAPFKNGIHNLRFLELQGCYLSNGTGNLVLNVIPYMAKVNIHFQNVTVSNAKMLASASRRSIAASVFRLKEIEFGYCFFENGTDAHLAKILPYVNNVMIFRSESLYSLQLAAEGISNILVNASVDSEKKLKNLELCDFDRLPSDVMNGLAAGIPYLENVSLNCVMLTKRFVTQLVESFLDTLKKNGKITLRNFQICCAPLPKQDSPCYKTLEASMTKMMPSINKSRIRHFTTANGTKHFELGGYEDFIADGIAKIIPFIPFVEFETVGLSLDDLKALSTSVLLSATSKEKKKYFNLQHFRFNLMYPFSLTTKYIYLMTHMAKLQNLTAYLHKELMREVTTPILALTTNFTSLLRKLHYCLLISKESDALLPVIKSHLTGIAKIVNFHMHLAQKLQIHQRKSNEAASFVILFVNQRVVKTLRKGKLKKDLEIVEKISADISSGIKKVKNDVFEENHNSIWCLTELERIERKVANCSNLNTRFNETMKAFEKAQQEELKLSLEIEELRASSRPDKYPALEMLSRRIERLRYEMIRLGSEMKEMIVQWGQGESRKEAVQKINSEFQLIYQQFKMAIDFLHIKSLQPQSSKYWQVKSLQEAARLIPFVKTVDMTVGIALDGWCKLLLENIRKIAMFTKFKRRFALRSLNLFIPRKGMVQDCSKLILKEFGVA